ncbi:MAG: sigma-70 family RNA polymerase sigma factor [Planctomycetales bacterium]|nr:sigma-70 family RNA polymerase sigma factor [Planctomycetales bacterium]MCA9170446.1 sigma-70 family RNA polymerase sigma factor [Planctomycetales bacterium]
MTTAKHEDLMESGQPLVYSIAAKVHRSVPIRVELDDLIAYGEVGLAEAARDFDPDQGAKFTTFAYYRIQGAIYDGLAKMTWTSRARYRRLRYEQMANEALAQENHAHRGSLSEEVGWLGQMTQKLGVVYLASQCDEESSLRDSAIEDANAKSVFIEVAQREMIDKLRSLLNVLPSVEQQLIREVYFEGATLQDAANKLGISKSWASRLHAKALEQLARALGRLGAD